MITLYSIWLVASCFWVVYKKFYEIRNDYPSWKLILLFLRDIALNNGFGASWFIMASIINSLLVYFLSKRKVTEVIGVVISIAFYCICLMMSWYSFLFSSNVHVQRILDGINAFFGNFRISFPAGTLFFYIGYYLSKKWDWICRISIKASIILFTSSFLLMLVEVLVVPFLPSFSRVSATAYITSLLVAPSLFLLCTRFFSYSNTKLSKYSFTARKISTVVYFSHTQTVLVSQLFFSKVFHISSSTIMFLLVLFSSLTVEIALSLLLIKLSETKKCSFVKKAF